jgi:hypothetical protein
VGEWAGECTDSADSLTCVVLHHHCVLLLECEKGSPRGEVPSALAFTCLAPSAERERPRVFSGVSRDVTLALGGGGEALNVRGVHGSRELVKFTPAGLEGSRLRPSCLLGRVGRRTNTLQSLGMTAIRRCRM